MCLEFLNYKLISAKIENSLDIILQLVLHLYFTCCTRIETQGFAHIVTFMTDVHNQNEILSLPDIINDTNYNEYFYCMSVIHFTDVSEDLVVLLQERHELREQVDMRRIAVEQLVRLQSTDMLPITDLIDLDSCKMSAIPSPTKSERGSPKKSPASSS